MKIFITGGTGFIGRHLCLRLMDYGHQVTAAGTKPSSSAPIPSGASYFQFNADKPELLKETLQDVDAVINLAGKSIFCWWSAGAKQKIYDSRIITTRALMKALPTDHKLTVISASAAGYYGDAGEEELTESSPKGEGFLADVCSDWENEALAVVSRYIRISIMRLGVVLGKGGGAISQMIPAFRFFLGGPLGKGTQWFPWIHIEDLIAAIQHLLIHPELSGAFNFTAPDPVRQKDFASTLGQTLNRPAIIPVPSFIISTLLGEFGLSLTASQKVIPERLQRKRFTFRYPDIQSALTNIVKE